MTNKTYQDSVCLQVQCAKMAFEEAAFILEEEILKPQALLIQIQKIERKLGKIWERALAADLTPVEAQAIDALLKGLESLASIRQRPLQAE